MNTITTTLPLHRARAYADKIVTWLKPHCVQIQIAGSIRRRRPECGDVDIVAIPVTVPHHDLLGAQIGCRNLCWEFLLAYVRDNPATKILFGGDKPGQYIILRLPKCQLDLWFATPETWATRLLCRTGSREHNIWLAQRAKDLGYHWNPADGLYYLGHSGEQHLGKPPIRTPDETAIYTLLRLPFIQPENREPAFFSNL